MLKCCLKTWLSCLFLAVFSASMCVMFWFWSCLPLERKNYISIELYVAVNDSKYSVWWRLLMDLMDSLNSSVSFPLSAPLSFRSSHPVPPRFLRPCTLWPGNRPPNKFPSYSKCIKRRGRRSTCDVYKRRLGNIETYTNKYTCCVDTMRSRHAAVTHSNTHDRRCSLCNAS